MAGWRSTAFAKSSEFLIILGSKAFAERRILTCVLPFGRWVSWPVDHKGIDYSIWLCLIRKTQQCYDGTFGAMNMKKHCIVDKSLALLNPWTWYNTEMFCLAQQHITLHRWDLLRVHLSHDGQAHGWTDRLASCDIIEYLKIPFL